jgi:hypothetical protein
LRVFRPTAVFHVKHVRRRGQLADGVRGVSAFDTRGLPSRASCPWPGVQAGQLVAVHGAEAEADIEVGAVTG